MRRACALLGLLALLLGACGKYGAPVRSRPAPPPGASAAGSAASAPAATTPGATAPDPNASEPTEPEEKQQEPSP